MRLWSLSGVCVLVCVWSGLEAELPKVAYTNGTQAPKRESTAGNREGNEEG